MVEFSYETIIDNEKRLSNIFFIRNQIWEENFQLCDYADLKNVMQDFDLVRKIYVLIKELKAVKDIEKTTKW